MNDNKNRRYFSTDVEARKLAEARLDESLKHVRYLLERSQQLLQIQRKITSRLSLNEVLDSVIRSATELLEVDAVETLLLNPDGKTFSVRALDVVQPSPVRAKTPTAERRVAERVIREGNLVVVEDTDREPEWQMSTLVSGEPIKAVASAPLQLEQKIIGALNVYCSRPKHFNEEELQTITMLAEGAAVAISNAQLYSEVARERNRLQTVLDTIPSGLVVTEEPNARITFMNQHFQELFGEPFEVGKPLSSYLDSIKLLHPDGRPYLPEELPFNRSMNSGEVVHGEEMIVETKTGQRSSFLLGSAPLYDEFCHIYGAVVSTEDVTLLRETQEALRQAYVRERRVSETLQQALLPSIPSRLGGLSLASAYRAALEEAHVGGDFFDIFSPTPDLVGVVVGDVAGKGVQAAVRTALTRHSLRAYAYIDPTPASVMEKLNDVIVRETPEESFVTVFYGLLDLRELTLRYVNAGHESPICLNQNSTGIIELSGTGIPLGIMPAITYEECTLGFIKGSKLLLYTDGVTEARSRGEFFGLERLKEFLSSHVKEPPVDFIDRLVDYLYSFSYPHLRDDISLLLVEMESDS